MSVLCQEGLPDCHESFAKASFTLMSRTIAGQRWFFGVDCIGPQLLS